MMDNVLRWLLLVLILTACRGASERGPDDTNKDTGVEVGGREEDAGDTGAEAGGPEEDAGDAEADANDLPATGLPIDADLLGPGPASSDSAATTVELWRGSQYTPVALVTTPTGALLALAMEASDHVEYSDSFVVRRSDDEGATWSEATEIAGSHSRPVIVVDRQRERILVLYDQRHFESSARFALKVRVSEDDGRSFEAGSPLPEVGPAEASWIDVEGAVGTQLARGDHPGRLILPAMGTPIVGTPGPRSYPFVLYSDDGGESFALGPQRADDEPQTAYGAGAIELEDGRVLLPSGVYDDDAPDEFPILDPSSFPSGVLAIGRYESIHQGAERSRLLAVVAAANSFAVWSSFDEGATWEAERRDLSSIDGSDGASLAVTPRGTIGVLYRGLPDTRGQPIVAFTSFGVETLDTPCDADCPPPALVVQREHSAALCPVCVLE